MKKFFSFLLLPALFFTGCKAQKVADNKSLLWKITGRDLAHPSYLFGTIHLLCPDDYLWTPAMQRSLKQCREVCFEMDMDDPEVWRVALNGMGENDGKALKDYFTPAQYEQLDRFAKQTLHADLGSMQQMTPIELQAMMMMKAVACTMPVSYEANIMEEAKRDKKEIVGLEAAQEQLAVLNSMPTDTVVKGIMQMADSFETSKLQYQQMLQAYKAQDLPGLFNIIASSKELGDDMGAFLDDRNSKWIPRMQGKMSKCAVFFAVGAGHLWGEKGVITLLRNAGYKVEPIR